MVFSGTVRTLGFTCLVGLPFTAALALLPPARAQNPVPPLPAGASDTQPDLTDPNNMRPLNQDGSILSLLGGQRLMGEANNAVTAQNYGLAAKKLQDARQVFNQLSNFYLQLSSSFSGIDNRIYEAQRKKALETAEMRDEATYQLALVHRAQNQPELAVPLLIQIVRSQNPTRELGKKAYQQLFELGFVDSPYPKPRGNESSSSTTPSK
jgi:thioredoxin-like negative regulator of GroEL